MTNSPVVRQSSWLNLIEPKWAHAKRNLVELDGLLTARQLAEEVHKRTYSVCAARLLEMPYGVTQE